MSIAPGTVVALGGGHGLAASLSALRTISADLTAVVTVADNGGSSGRLREELGVLPPGDLREALAALCRDDEWGHTWAQVLQHRFSSGGELHNHAMGNLLIVALWELLDDHVKGLDLVASLLGAQGRVLPMSAVPLNIEADVRWPVSGDDGDGAGGAIELVRGQAQVATTRGHVESVRLVPAEPAACTEAVAAVDHADWVVLGPGSWYTSVLPHLLVPDLAAALRRSPARRCVTLNVAAGDGETDGFDLARYLSVLADYAKGFRVDVVLADQTQVLKETEHALRDTAASLGAELVVADVRASDGAARHDVTRLANAYSRILR